MKIQQKLLVGLGFLFVLIVSIAGLSLSYVHRLTADTRNILEDNDHSLLYVRSMLDAMDQDTPLGIDTVQFDRFLRLQEQNITEAGETEITSKLRSDYQHALHANDLTNYAQRIRADLVMIMTLNIQALERKSVLAQSSGQSASTFITAASSLCFILALVLMFNLPRMITKPIRELREGIYQISARNYATRLHMDRKDEFRDIANAFNLLAAQLGEYYKSSISTIMTEKKRVESLVNAMHDPVLILDEQRSILFVNEIASHVLGMSANELLHQSATEIALNNDLMRSMLQSALPVDVDSKSITPRSLKIVNNGREEFYEVEHQRLESSIDGALTDDTPLLSNDGTQRQYLGDVIVLRNVTTFREHDVAKSSFMATVSHELKTPLSSIKLSVQLLKRLGRVEDQSERELLLHSIEDDCTRLSRISSELLNISQSETGNISLALQSCDGLRIAQYAMESVKNLADQKQIVLTLESDPNLPPFRADAEKITWVLINFLTNAIRYSPEMSEVHVRLTKAENAVECSVQDSGKGIDERYRDRIFDRYFQIPGSSKSGSGLGLAISREFVEALGGSIGVQSEVGVGSTFRFRLPQAP